MAKIKTEKQYKAACSRIEELLKVVSNDTPTDDKNFLELDLISDLVAEYEEEHFPIETPSLVDVIKLHIGMKLGEGRLDSVQTGLLGRLRHVMEHGQGDLVLCCSKAAHGQRQH